MDGSIESSKPTRKSLLVLDTDHFSEWVRVGYFQWLPETDISGQKITDDLFGRAHANLNVIEFAEARARIQCLSFHKETPDVSNDFFFSRRRQ